MSESKYSENLRKRLNQFMAVSSLVFITYAIFKLFSLNSNGYRSIYDNISLFVILMTCVLALGVFLILNDSVISQNTESELDNDSHIFRMITKEIDERKKRLIEVANINLAIGLIFAALGLTLPILVFRDIDEISLNSKLKLIDFITRSGYILMFLTISFFFFRVYRSIKEDITYFINEKNNVSFKIAAYKILQQNKDSLEPEMFSKIIHELIVIDRNFKFGAGESNMRVKALENEVSEHSSWIMQFMKNFSKND